MRFESFALSDVGRVRSENEDSSGLFPEWNLFVVADGMGGHVGGKEASQVAVDTIAERFRAAKLLRSEDRAVLLEAIAEANRRIRDRAERDPGLRGMGTTLVALLLDQGTAAVAHVGDSRAYRLRDETVEQLTADHSLVADLVRRRDISETEARVHPYRHVLTRALGMADEVAVEVSETDVRAGDLYVLNSDGVYGMLSRDEFDRLLIENSGKPEQVCRELVAAANTHGGKDNATVVAVRCIGD